MTELPFNTRFFIAGHRGMVGSAIERALRAAGYREILTRTHRELDLTEQADVRAFFARERPECVVLAAAKVGGIQANNLYRADFIAQNLAIQNNVITEAHRHGVRRLLFLGSSCIYPKNAPQPIPESALLTGSLEPTNQPYAIAKIAGIEMCDAYRRQYGCDFRSAMPTNLYGPGDNFDLSTSHVIPALLRKFHEAHAAGIPSVQCWGSGSPRREFLHVDDLAAACLRLLSIPRDTWDERVRVSHVNVGFGSDVTIAELAGLVRDTVGFGGRIDWDSSKPDGTPRKLMDSSLIHSLGWQPAVSLTDGLRSTYQWFVDHILAVRGADKP